MNPVLAEMLVRTEITEQHRNLINDALILIAERRLQVQQAPNTDKAPATNVVNLFARDPVAGYFKQLETCLKNVAEYVHLIYDMVMSEYDIIGTKYSGKPLDELFVHHAEEYLDMKAMLDTEMAKLEGLMANRPN